MKITQILDKIDENQLFVPAFQREYVWKRDNVKSLMHSLINEYPTGTILSWETNNPPELKGNVAYHENMGAVKLILDGQQRITSLYLIIRGEIPPYYTEKEIIQDTRNLYVNIDSLELQYYVKKRMENNPLWINLTDIFQLKIKPRNIVKDLSEKQELSTELEDRIFDNHHKIFNILSFDFLEQSIPIKANVREAIDIFYIVNASGVSLTDAELALAQISGYWPEARDVIKKKLFSLAEKGFVFNLDFFIYVLLGVIHHMGSDMKRLHSEENKEIIKETWKKLDEKIIDYVLNILQSQGYVDHTKEINSVYALVPFIVFAYIKDGHMSEQRIKKAVKWFYYSQLRQRYISQLQSKLDKDINVIVNSENPFDELLAIIQSERPLEIQPEEFVGVGVNHPLFSLMRWFFKSKNAVCLTTGLSIRKNMGKHYGLERDHIFPYSVLKSHGYNMDNRHKYQLAQEITNRAILTSLANRSKSDMSAKDYLSNVSENYPNALELQCIPFDNSLWEIENFELFLNARRRILTEELNNWLDGITEMMKPEIDLTIEELIQEEESTHLEFKSSLRWDYVESKVNKSLEKVILKTIAAFNNADGGVLIIGVDDDGNALGLENDYISLLGDRDRFERHLLTIVSNEFSTGYASSNLSVNFHTINDNEICEIDVKRGDDPLFNNVREKGGQKVEKFYIRRGNATSEISNYSEVTQYIKERF